MTVCPLHVYLSDALLGIELVFDAHNVVSLRKLISLCYRYSISVLNVLMSYRKAFQFRFRRRSSVVAWAEVRRVRAAHRRERCQNTFN